MLAEITCEWLSNRASPHTLEQSRGESYRQTVRLPEHFTITPCRLRFRRFRVTSRDLFRSWRSAPVSPGPIQPARIELPRTQGPIPVLVRFQERTEFEFSRPFLLHAPHFATVSRRKSIRIASRPRSQSIPSSLYATVLNWFHSNCLQRKHQSIIFTLSLIQYLPVSLRGNANRK